MMNCRKIPVLLMCLLGSLCAFAQYSPSRHIQSSLNLEAGHGTLYDTYLSPLKYRGVSLALTANWSKALPQDSVHLVMDFDARISGDITKNPAGNASMYNLGVAFDWGLSYRWRPAPRWEVTAGGAVGFDSGCLYLPRNGNNPADARLAVSLSLKGSAQYSFRIKSVPVRVFDEVRIPSASVMFAHDFAEPYYEIYLGNRSGLVKGGWWGNNFRIDNLLAGDFTLGGHTLRVGYRFRVYSSWINHLNTQLVTHAAVVGLVF